MRRSSDFELERGPTISTQKAQYVICFGFFTVLAFFRSDGPREGSLMLFSHPEADLRFGTP